MSEVRLLIREPYPYTTGIIKPYEGSNAEECSICISNDEFTYKSWVELRCGHAFHRHCIDLWLENHRTCPICVQDVDARPVNNLNANARMKMHCCCILGGCIFLAGMIALLVYFFVEKKFIF